MTGVGEPGGAPAAVRVRRGRPPPGRGEGGSALLLALLALLALTALATGGLVLSSLERRSAGIARAAVRARYLAEAGLADYLAGELPDGDTLRLRYPGGAARVWAEALVRLDGERRLYRIVSRGEARTDRGRRVERELSTVALDWSQTLSRLPAAAYVALDGLRLDPGASVSGEDRCEGGTGAGVYAAAGAPVEGDRSGVRGRPPVAEGGDPRSELRRARLAWRGLASGELLRTGGRPASGAGPERAGGEAGGWQVHRLGGRTAALGPSDGGSGVIVAAGALVLEEGFGWKGVLLAGGPVRARGRISVEGLVASGLGRGTGDEPAGPGSTGAGSRFVYDSCAVGRASRALVRATRRLIERPGERAEAI